MDDDNDGVESSSTDPSNYWQDDNQPPMKNSGRVGLIIFIVFILLIILSTILGY